MAQAERTLADGFQRAVRHHQAGELQQAATLCREVLAIDPRHADSRHLLGMIALQVGQADAALACFDDAIRLRPRSADYHNSRGRSLRELRRLGEAEAAFREALRLRGRFPEALNNLGIILLMQARFADAEACGRKAVRLDPDAWEAHTLLGHALGGLGRHEEAVACHRATVRLRPDVANAHNNLGHALSQLGRSAEAEACYREALRLNPNSPDACNNLACCLKDLGHPAEAEPYFRDALRLRPDFAEALTNLADALEKLRRYEEAETSCRAALQLKPGLPDAHNTLGSILGMLGRSTEAEAACRTALQLRPNFAMAHNNLGCILKDLRRAAEAEVCFREAVRLRPNLPEAHNNLGTTLKDLGRLEEAEAALRAALRLRPNFQEAEVNLSILLLLQCRYDEVVPRYEKILAENPDMGAAWRALLFSLPYIPGFDCRKSFAIHRAFGRAVARGAKPLPLHNDRDPDRRLRIGWSSSDFRNHPVARNLELIFARRDRSKFEAICYSGVKTPDAMTDKFRSQADLWRSTVGMDDAAVAELIRSDRIDVMIYLAGRFDDNRPQIAMRRPAPVQISFHDVATSGLDGMDYLIADPVLVPRHTPECFTERVLRLPNFCLHAPPQDSPPPSDPPSLSGCSVTFGCFHNPTKLNSSVFALWAELLRRIPRARLRFKYLERYASDSLQAMIRRRLGMELADRIEFDPTRTPLGQHLAQYNQVDIALDPFPFNGSTATFEALWMGVPVVTLAGDMMVSRWAASMLSKIGLTELIATTPQQYIDIASRLAADQQRLRELRASLRDQVRRSPLCDGPRTTRYLERAFRAVWRKWCHGAATNPTTSQAAERSI
jgi:predicted O-linked N-acetylglucosamine transferase (SPINDLY family)